MQQEKPRPIAEGNFRQKPFAHILVYLMGKKLSGTLEVSDQYNKVAIYFRGGMPAKVTTSIEGKLLGQVLLDLRKITRDQLLASQKEMATLGGLQGQILLKQGAITAADLVSGITYQMMAKLTDVFVMPDADFAFYQKVNLLTGAGPAELIQLDTLALLMFGVRAHGTKMELDSVLNSLKDKHLFLKDAKTLTRFNLNKSERILCRLLLEKPRTLDELSENATIDQRSVRCALYVFAITKVLNTEDTRATRRSDIPMAAQRLDSIAPPPPEPTSYPPEVQELREKIQYQAAQIASQNYFEMLGLDAKSTPEDARKAFFQAAKIFHPDKATSPQLVDLKETLEYIFANLSEAHATLIDPDAREEYENAISSGAKRTSEMPDAAEEQEVVDALEAENLFQKALILVRRKKYKEAYEFMDRAHMLTPNQGDYKATWAHLQMILFKKDKAGLEELVSVFRDATELSPKSERVHLYFALLLKKIGRDNEALTKFKMVMELNPNNIEAGREVQIMQMRKNKEMKKKNRSLLDKILY